MTENIKWNEFIKGLENKRQREEHRPESVNIEPQKLTIKELLKMPLSEIEALDISLEIYSDHLGEVIWFCSNEKQAQKIREQYPEQVAYLISEIKELTVKRASPEHIKALHEAKRVFINSKVLSHTKKETNNTEQEKLI